MIYMMFLTCFVCMSVNVCGYMIEYMTVCVHMIECMTLSVHMSECMTHTLCVCVCACYMYVWFSSCVTWGPWKKHDFLAASPWQAASLSLSVLHAQWNNKINVVSPFGLSTHSPQ